MFKKPDDPSDLETTLKELFNELRTTPPDSKEYAKITKQVERLYALKKLDAPKRVDPDTWVVAGANLLGILLIVGAEYKSVVTSKALGFIQKLK